MKLKESKVNKLNKAKSLKNDEFYTLMEDVINIYDKVEKSYNLNNFIIDLPFDGEQSNFYKYAKSKNYKINIDGKFDYKKFNYSKNGIVISNPPFSILREVIDFFISRKINFILVCPLNSFIYKNILNYFNNKLIFYSYTSIKNFVTPNGEIKHVACYLMHNLDKLDNDYWTPIPKKESKIKKVNNNQLFLNFENNIIEKKDDEIILENSCMPPFLKNVHYTINYIFCKDANKHNAVISPLGNDGEKKIYKRLLFLV